ncbi:hypothetical protein [Cupriavidus gilardii]|uniref:hypothetical protein n=1 Tax=Cupriavidus gilardii TaxID=82541 RepID=UPI0012E95D5C|nr:hypothetical protein [Cupriavidus gilardii]
MTFASIIDTIKFDPDFDPSNGFKCRRISFFDHFLSNTEADSCTFIFYRLAIENGSLPDFFVAENRLLSLWARLAISGKTYGMKDKAFEMQSLHDVLSLGSNVIRELSGHPVYFSSFNVIWEPASDLTHLLWIPKDQSWTQIESLVQEADLHLLD